MLQLTKDGKTILEEKQFPTSDRIIMAKTEIEPNTTHTYTIQVTFKELEVAQNYNQGKRFAGKIEIVETDLAKTIIFDGDRSNANAPELNNGLIPVIWNGKEWAKADTTKEWYNYDNQAWANAVTVTPATRNTYTTAKANTIISMNDIETMWVWIPRYEYQYTNLGDQYAGGTKTKPGAITINFISKNTTTASDPDNYIIHDAFWWDDNNDGVKDVNEQLSGIWVAKFEMSTGNTTCTPLDFSIGTGCDSSAINPQIKPNVTSWRGARIGTFWTAIHNNMNGSSNQYGLTNTDAHLMKNMEWGVAAYLSQSKYGKYGNPEYARVDKEIYQNTSLSYITGMSNGTPSEYEENFPISYDVEKVGTGASTTGNIYGIYDMHGGAIELVMGIQTAKETDEPSVGYDIKHNSGWNGKLIDDITDFISDEYGYLKDIGSKYYDLYVNDPRAQISDRFHSGDATYETVDWYQDMSFVRSYNSFFGRGSDHFIWESSGIFSMYLYTGAGQMVFSGRPALVPLN